MKICLLTYRGNMYCGGQGIYVYYLSRELQRLGHEVDVISGPPYPDVAEGVKLHKLKSHSVLVSRYGANHSGPIQTTIDLFEFAATCVGVYAEPLAFSIRAYREIKKLASEVKFDVVHDNQCLGYGLAMIRRLQLPIVATIHHPIGIDREADFKQARSRRERLRRHWFYSFYVSMQSRVARHIDQVITVSECSAREIERLIGVPSSRIRVVYNGVDTNLFKNNQGVAKEPHSLIFVGNTEDRKKGIIHLLQALRLIKDECPVKLTIIDGGAQDTTYAHALVRKYGLQDRVMIVRRLSSEELVRRYVSAEIAAIPSLFEGFGFPAAEAMACELPVIATKAGALPELVSDGHNGILVEPGDVPGLAAGIKLLLNDEQLRRKMGQAGRKIAEHKFNWEKAAKQMFEVYQLAQ